MRILARLWVGIVASTAGVSCGLVLSLLALVAIDLPFERGLWLIAAFAAVAFMLGIVIGPRDL